MASTFGHSRVAAALARGRLGALPLSGLLLAAVTPLVVVIGVMPVAYAASGMRARKPPARADGYPGQDLAVLYQAGSK